MSEVNLGEVDDFFVASESSDIANDLFESYSVFEKKMQELPRSISLDEDSSRLNFFKEVHSNRKHEALYRRRQDSNITLTLYWISRVKELASMYASLNQIPKFDSISKQDLKELAKMSSDVHTITKLEDLLSKKGIIFITEKTLPGLKLDGSVFLLPSGQAVVALSLRYKRLDYFWFTLMHELAHLCLHSEILNSPIIEDLDSKAKTVIELEADKLALDSFIPRNIWRNCPPKYDPSEKEVIAFANSIEIHPAIVAGRLRKELNRYEILSKLVNQINVWELF